MCVCVYVHACVCMCVYVCVSVCKCVYMYVCACECKCVYAYIQVVVALKSGRVLLAFVEGRSLYVSSSSYAT
jgi:hypothetical protein